MTESLAGQLSLYLSSRFPGAVVSEVNFLTSGFESEIHTFRFESNAFPQTSYILRLFTGEGASDKLAREARALALLKEAGYPVPALLLQEPDTDVLGKPFEIIERLEGQALWPLLAAAEPLEQKALLSRFGSLLAQLHQLDWRLFMENQVLYEQNPLQFLEKTIAQYHFLYTKYNLQGFLQVVGWLDHHKHEISIHPAVIHQDFHANNVFQRTDNRFVVIDWTQFDIADSRIDLAWTLLIMGDLGNVNWKQPIFEAYTSEMQKQVEDLDYFEVIVCMKLLASTVISFLAGSEELGLRPDTLSLSPERVSIYQQLAQRIELLTGLKIPELENVFRKGQAIEPE